MQKQTIYNRYHSHINIIRGKYLNLLPQSDYICPLCLKTFSNEDISTEQITIEHSPQDALGGKPIVLTCKECNSVQGSSTDCQLINYIDKLEFKIQIAGATQKGAFNSEFGNINATLEVEDSDGTMKLKVSEKNNNRKINDELGKLFTEGDMFEFQGKVKKMSYKYIEAAILKNAYLILFAQIGYPITIDSKYDNLRNYIQNPDSYFIPKPLWRIFSSLNVNDGVYLWHNRITKGFAIIYTLRKMTESRVVVLLPAISTSSTFQKVASFLRKIRIGCTMKLTPISSDYDCLQDIDHIDKLYRWAKSKDNITDMFSNRLTS